MKILKIFRINKFKIKKMSNENTKIETYESLSEIDYHLLKEKFETLGVKEAWKPGTKKKDMIKTALEKLKLVQSLKDSGLEGEELKEAVKEKEEVIQGIKQKEEVKKAEIQEAQEKEVVKELESKEYSQEVIQDNLDRINLALKKCIPTHRTILIKKKELLEKQLIKAARVREITHED